MAIARFPDRPPRKPPAKLKVNSVLGQEFEKFRQLLTSATKNENNHMKQMNATTAFQGENMFGSGIGDHALSRAQHRYHLIKWRSARRCIQRRVSRLAYRIKQEQKR
jgi:hypothetical protein